MPVVRAAYLLVLGLECPSRLRVFVVVASVGSVVIVGGCVFLRGLIFGVSLCFRIGHGIGERSGWCRFERIDGVLVV